MVSALLLVSAPSVAPSLASAAALGAPTVTAASGDARLTLRWTAPPGAVTDYQLSHRVYRPGRRAFSKWATVQLGKSVRARSLRGPNGTLRQFRVRALSRGGPGHFSPTAGMWIGVPGMPTAQSQHAPTSLRITWKAPSGNGARITSYLLGLRSYTGGGTWTSWSKRSTSAKSRTFVFRA